jgi:hypothetical protein
MKRLKNKPKKRNPIKTLENKCDKIFSLVVRKRGYCQWPGCHKLEGLQCSHIHSRTKMSVRWDLNNALCLCCGCHKYRWHLHPIDAAEVAKNYLGEYEYNALNIRARQLKCDYTVEDLKAIYEHLEKLYGT